MVGMILEPEVEPAVLSKLSTAPGEGECLFCFVYRMTEHPGCDGTLRWAQRWRDLRAPRVKASRCLPRRLIGIQNQTWGSFA